MHKINFDTQVQGADKLREEFTRANRPTRTLSLAYAMTLNGMFILALAIAVWSPMLINAFQDYQVWGHLGPMGKINVATLMYGTAYFLITQGLVTLALVFTPWDRTVEKVVVRIESHNRK